MRWLPGPVPPCERPLPPVPTTCVGAPVPSSTQLVPQFFAPFGSTALYPVTCFAHCLPAKLVSRLSAPFACFPLCSSARHCYTTATTTYMCIPSPLPLRKPLLPRTLQS